LFRQLLSQAATKNARVKNTIRAKWQGWKMREQIAVVENAPVGYRYTADSQPKNKLKQWY